MSASKIDSDEAVDSVVVEPVLIKDMQFLKSKIDQAGETVVKDTEE